MDIAAGFAYFEGGVKANIEHVTDKFPGAQGGVFHSLQDVTTWAKPVSETTYDKDWISSFDLDWWEHAITLENPGGVPDFVAYAQRRARRLNALVPPR